MCRTCGCDSVSFSERLPDIHRREQAPPRKIQLEVDLLAKNDSLAATNRDRFARERVLALNLIGAPGAGKTALLEATIRRLRGELSLAVLEGDQATERDAERIRSAGCPALQINTGAGCHLDASMIARALNTLAPAAGSVLFIENVGNLVCPALFDLGEHAKVVVMSVTEGEDKPLKYPHVFRAADLFVLSKLDLAAHAGFDAAECIENARSIHPELEILPVSAKRDNGVSAFADWIRRRVTQLSPAAEAEDVSP